MRQIIRFFIERPLLSLVVIFLLWVSYLPLPDTNIGAVREYNKTETTIGGFVNPDRGPVPEGTSNRGPDRLEGYDPSPKIQSVDSSGSTGVNLNLQTLENNEVPDKKNWKVNEWDDDGSTQCNQPEQKTKTIESKEKQGQNDEGNESQRKTKKQKTKKQKTKTSESKEKQGQKELPVAVDFDYEIDSNGNPTLLIPNLDSTSDLPFHRVEFDQAASHLHHVEDYGIQLPASFDMDRYNNLPTKFDKIDYAKKNLPRDIIISYQNSMGLSMIPNLGNGSTTHSVPGYAGINKADVSLVIQSIPTTQRYYLSIVNERGTHVSSYSISASKLRQIIKNNFWVLLDRKFH